MNEFIDVAEKDKYAYNGAVDHPMQSYEWGEFRKATGVTVERKALTISSKFSQAFSLTIHKVPKTPFTIGYLPKGTIPSEKLLQELRLIGKKYNSIFIQLEPNLTITQTNPDWEKLLAKRTLYPSFHPLFTKYTFILDIRPSEENLLKNMHSKTRYNIRVAQRHGVEVAEENTDKAFEEYLAITEETTKRQKFYAHSPQYHTIQWQVLPHAARKPYQSLSSHLLVARYQGVALTTWIVFVFKNSLYYPYGASSNKHRNLMASNLMMWETIRFGKKLGLTYFDMWGALGKNPDLLDPWYGFHHFKEGYGPVHTEFVGSYDLVLNPYLYRIYQGADKLRWSLLRLRK